MRLSPSSQLVIGSESHRREVNAMSQMIITARVPFRSASAGFGSAFDADSLSSIEFLRWQFHEPGLRKNIGNHFSHLYYSNKGETISCDLSGWVCFKGIERSSPAGLLSNCLVLARDVLRNAGESTNQLLANNVWLRLNAPAQSKTSPAVPGLLGNSAALV